MVTWTDPGAGRPAPAFTGGGTGAWLAGIHGNVAELTDGRWLAFGRGDTINGMMPKSISSDPGFQVRPVTQFHQRFAFASVLKQISWLS